jgi:hypothetical protein
MTKLCPRGKAAAKRKFKVYPSAYANAYASKICAGKIKDPSGVKRKDFKGPKPAGKVFGGVIATAGKVLGKKGIKYLKSPEGRKKTKEIMDSPLSKNMKEKLEKLKKTFGKRAGGMTAGSMMNKPKKAAIGAMMIGKKMMEEKMPAAGAALKMKKKLLGMNKGGGADMSKVKTKKTGPAGRLRKGKRKPTMLDEKGFQLKYPNRGSQPGNPVVMYSVKKGGLTAELNNPAKGYTAGGMADYYKDLM